MEAVPHRFLHFVEGDRRGARFLHDDAGRDIGEKHGVFDGQAGCQPERQHRDDGIAGSGDVEYLVRQCGECKGKWPRRKSVIPKAPWVIKNDEQAAVSMMRAAARTISWSLAMGWAAASSASLRLGVTRVTPEYLR